MDLYLIRHAEAVPLTQMDVNADEDRPLTEHGLAQSRALSAVLQRRGVAFRSILTSPLLRARQTAQTVIDHWAAPAPEIRVCEPLAPEVKVQKLAKFLLGIDDGAVALVGHMPDLADFASWLIGSKKARLDFEKAGVALIRSKGYIDKGAGKLEWLVTPEWFM